MVGVVIPVFVNTERGLSLAKTSIESYATDLPDWAEIVIVANGCDVTMADDLRDCHYHHEFIDLPINLGYTAAVNIGLKTAVKLGADHFVVGSADIIVRDGWLQALVVGHGLRSAVEHGAWPDCAHAGLCPFWGGLYAFPKTLLDRIGFLDETYTRIGDAAFACRAAADDWPIVRAAVVVEHRHPGSANRAHDPVNSIFEREVGLLKARYGDPCTWMGAR